MPLDARSKERLLTLAREAIAAKLEGTALRPEPPDDPALLPPAGAFVSLHRGRLLRGCIGRFEASAPLYRTVAEMARSAAFEDPRFPPLEPRELEEVELEISVLTPLRPVEDPEEVEVGRHGVYVVRGPYRGVLLPQVATDHGWDRTRFLAETCRKAGLPPEAWQEPDTTILVFEAEVFGEEVTPRSPG